MALSGRIPLWKNQSRQFVIPDIGAVSVHTFGSRRHISVRIDICKGVTVTVPARASFTEAREFMLSRVPWGRASGGHHGMRSTGQDAGLPPVDRGRQASFFSPASSSLRGQHGFRYNRLFIKNQRRSGARARR